MEKEEIELNSLPAVIDLPELAVGVKLTITIFENGKLSTVETELGLADINKAFVIAHDAELDVRFVLTEKGKAELNKLKGGE